MLNGRQHLLRISHMSHATSHLMPWFIDVCSKRECFGVCAAWGLWDDSESESGRRGIDASSLVVCRSHLLPKVLSGANSNQFLGLSWKMASACTPKQLVQKSFNFNFRRFSLFRCRFHDRHWICMDLLCFLGFAMFGKGKTC